jgi:hypothetical protein
MNAEVEKPSENITPDQARPGLWVDLKGWNERSTIFFSYIEALEIIA